MLCQFCGEHEATNKFLVNFMGYNREVAICDECLKNFQQYTGVENIQQLGMQQSGNINGMPGWPMASGFQKEKVKAHDPFNVDNGNEVRTKRKLNQLHKQLKNAIDAENYEDAAILRDEINDIKKDVFINGK